MNYRILSHEIIDNLNSRILEIGPLNSPLLTKDKYPNLLYCDIRNTEEIKKLYSSNDYLSSTGIEVDINTIVDIDVVLKDSYQKTFESSPKFDYIFASHVLEHVDDIIFVLQDISTILAPGGKLFIKYPDKRYCFDHFRTEASFRDAYDVYINKRPALARMVLDFFSSAIPENDPLVFWKAEKLNELLPNSDMQYAIELYEKVYSGELMDDVHYWPFTDIGFIKFLYDITRAELNTLSCDKFYPTQENTQEFAIILQKRESWCKQLEVENLKNLYSQLPNNYYNSSHIKQESLINNIRNCFTQNGTPIE